MQERKSDEEMKPGEKRSLRPTKTAEERSEEIATGRGSQRPIRGKEEKPEK